MIIILLLCFFAFLYILYYLSREDFVIIRRDISIERVFSLAFLTSLVSLFFARLFFVLANPEPKLINPLGFFALPYHPGLSLIGGIGGGALFIFLYCRYKAIPIGKMVDLFSLSILGVLPLGLIGEYILSFGKVDLFFILFFISSIFMLILFARVIYPFSCKGEIEDGSLGLIFIAILSFFYFTIKLFLDIREFSFLELDNILTLVLLFSSLVLLVNQEIIEKFLAKNE